MVAKNIGVMYALKRFIFLKKHSSKSIAVSIFNTAHTGELEAITVYDVIKMHNVVRVVLSKYQFHCKFQPRSTQDLI